MVQAGRIELTRTTRLSMVQERKAVEDFCRWSETSQQGAALFAEAVEAVRNGEGKPVTIILDMNDPKHKELKGLVENQLLRLGAQSVHGICVRFQNHGVNVVVIANNSHVCDEAMREAIQKLYDKQQAEGPKQAQG